MCPSRTLGVSGSVKRGVQPATITCSLCCYKVEADKISLAQITNQMPMTCFISIQPRLLGNDEGECKALNGIFCQQNVQGGKIHGKGRVRPIYLTKMSL